MIIPQHTTPSKQSSYSRQAPTMAPLSGLSLCFQSHNHPRRRSLGQRWQWSTLPARPTLLTACFMNPPLIFLSVAEPTLAHRTPFPLRQRRQAASSHAQRPSTTSLLISECHVMEPSATHLESGPQSGGMAPFRPFAVRSEPTYEHPRRAMLERCTSRLLLSHCQPQSHKDGHSRVTQLCPGPSAPSGPSALTSRSLGGAGRGIAPPHRASSTALLTGEHRESWRYVASSPQAASQSMSSSYAAQPRLRIPSTSTAATLIGSGPSRPSSAHPLPQARSVSTNTPATAPTKRFSFAPSKPTAEEVEEQERRGMGAWGVFADLQDGAQHPMYRPVVGADERAAAETSDFSIATSLGTVIRQRVGQSVTPSSHSGSSSFRRSAVWDVEAGHGSRHSMDDDDGAQFPRYSHHLQPTVLVASPPSMYTPLRRSTSPPRSAPPSVPTFPSPAQSTIHSQRPPGHSFDTRTSPFLSDQLSRPDSLMEQDNEDEDLDQSDRRDGDRTSFLSSEPSTPRPSSHGNPASHLDPGFRSTSSSAYPTAFPITSPTSHGQSSPVPNVTHQPRLHSLPATAPVARHPWFDAIRKKSMLGLSRQQLDVLKCATAYTLASLFTFNSRLNSLLPSPSSAQYVSSRLRYFCRETPRLNPLLPLPFLLMPLPSLCIVNFLHLRSMVATIAVYYNPAKSVGAMIEADMLYVSVCSGGRIVDGVY